MNRPNSQTLALMDAARSAHGDCSDYVLSKLLGVNTSATTAWRKRGLHMSDAYAARCAEIAGIDPVAAVIRVAAEREKGPAVESLHRALARLTGAAASVLLASVLIVGSLFGIKTAAAAGFARLSSTPIASPVIYYVKFIMRAWLRAAHRFTLPQMVLA